LRQRQDRQWQGNIGVHSYPHPRHRRKYPQLLQTPAYAHLRLVHLTSPRAADAWLNGVGV
jgi:hypothetical protein